MKTNLKIVAFANCAMNSAPWLTNLYPNSEISTFIHTEGLLRLMKGYTITCQTINPPLKKQMPILTPIDVSKIDAFIWSPLVDECVGISMLQDIERSPYPIDSEDSHKLFPPGPLYHIETLKIIWKELNEVTKSILHRFVVTYPTTHLNYDLASFRAGIPDIFKNRVEKLNETAANLLTSFGWIHYEFEPELDETKYWCHFSKTSRENVYKKIEKDLNL